MEWDLPASIDEQGKDREARREAQGSSVRLSVGAFF
jgi:hypothetical protein